MLNRRIVFFVIFLGVLGVELAGSPRVGLGIDMLRASGFQGMEGKRVGLLTHKAGVTAQGRSTIEVLYRDDRINLVCLFSPEHGLDGDVKFEESVGNGVHEKTGLPVYSLYKGKVKRVEGCLGESDTRRPSKAMLNKIDVMLVDLQEVGVRPYTYVSCMAYVMEECFKHGVEVVVLDRPNPLGGDKVEGPMLNMEYKSYVGLFPIPYVHGMTIGEIALMAKGEPGWLDMDYDLVKAGRLKVVKMKGWRRNMPWPVTGLGWVAPSPRIPSSESAIGYAMTGLGTREGPFRIGTGSPYCFRLIGFGKTDVGVLKSDMDAVAKDLGLELRKVKLQGTELVSYEEKGEAYLYPRVYDYEKWSPGKLNFWMMKWLTDWKGRNLFAEHGSLDDYLFRIHVGDNDWLEELKSKGSSADIMKFIAKWKQQAAEFKQKSRKYWLY